MSDSVSIPLNCSYPIKLGSTLKPDPESTYSIVRYNFKPENIDQSRGSYIIGMENSQIQITFGDKKSSKQMHVYDGNFLSVNNKDLDYLLVYDPLESTFTLEKIKYNCTLRHQNSKKAKHVPDIQQRSIPSTKNNNDLDIDHLLDEELERELSLLDQ
jgi:hypothetical protein